MPSDGTISIPADSDFSLQNLPYGVFSPVTTSSAATSTSAAAHADALSTAAAPHEAHHGARRRVGVALGNRVVDLSILHGLGMFEHAPLIESSNCFLQEDLRQFVSLGRRAWTEARDVLTAVLTEAVDRSGGNGTSDIVREACWPLDEVTMHLPLAISNYTDFYASKQHATNVGSMFRDPKTALNPNWHHLPVGYHGRASSIVVSGTPVRRPLGQVMPSGGTAPELSPSRVLDFELEAACIVGPGNQLGERIHVDDAADHVFGVVLMNDWSARDIQRWEYVPLGPFNGKNWATTISPWVVTLDAVRPFRCPAPIQEPAVLPYLQEADRHSYDIHLEASVRPDSCDEETVVTRTNFRNLYWTFPQMVAHHTVGGCNLLAGDLMGTGTISSSDPTGLGSMLELSWNGTREVQLVGGQVRKFLEDGDTVALRGYCQGDGFRVGFGECAGLVLPAVC